MANKNLTSAKKAKEDEFYTQLSDIENELRHYKEQFRGKTVLCNCDDPRVSNFFFYFKNNFNHLGLKRVITTCYKNQDIDLFSDYKSEQAVYLIYDGYKDKIDIKPLQGDGDFRSRECIELLKQADIVVTNPPFSLFREYVAQLMAYGKKFLIIGNQNNSTYKEIFSLIKSNKLWWGYNYGDMSFHVPADAAPRATRFWIDDSGQKWRSFGNICWYTNLDVKKRNEELIMYKHFSSKEYPCYDNFDAINVNRVTDIPCDYNEVMGVPVTFFGKFNPTQFELIGQLTTTKVDEYNFGYPYIAGKKKFARILIRKRNNNK